MDKIKLDSYEQKIEDNILKAKKVSKSRLAKIKTIINRANEKKNISLRVNGQDLDQLKLKAEKEGLPYQTLISSILHKFVTDQLVDQKHLVKSLQIIKAK